MTKLESLFRKEFLFSREDVVRSVERYMEFVEYGESKNKQGTRQKKRELCERFIARVKKCKLPELKEPWWFYEYEDTGTGMELWLRLGDDLKTEEGGRYIAGMTIADEHLLLRVEDELLPIEQFARVQEVSVYTVRYWLKKGRLRFARKCGKNWMIPAATDRPDRHWRSVQYRIDPADPPKLEEYPLIPFCDSLIISRNETNKKQFECHFFNADKHLHEKIILDITEVEGLEFELMKSGKAHPDPPPQWRPHIR